MQNKSQIKRKWSVSTNLVYYITIDEVNYNEVNGTMDFKLITCTNMHSRAAKNFKYYIVWLHQIKQNVGKPMVQSGSVLCMCICVCVYVCAHVCV